MYSLHCLCPTSVYPLTPDICPATGNRSWVSPLYPRSQAASREGGLVASVDISIPVGGGSAGPGAAGGGVGSGGGFRSGSNHGSAGGSVFPSELPLIHPHGLFHPIILSSPLPPPSSVFSLPQLSGCIILEDEEDADKVSVGSRSLPGGPLTKPLILQAVTDILSHLLREQRSVVVVVEDAHEMDEQSWKVLLSLVERRDTQTYSLFVFTHESMSNLHRATLASVNALKLAHQSESSSSSYVMGGPSNTASALTNNAPPPLTARGGRANTTISSSFHDSTFLRLSYESTLISLKQLKKGTPCRPNLPYSLSLRSCF